MLFSSRFSLALAATLGTCTGAWVLAAPPTARAATIIGIDFNNGGATNQSPGSTAIVGPYASAGWYNNVNMQNTNLGPGSVSLQDSNGASTTATFGWTLYPNTTLQGLSIYNSALGATGAADSSLTPDQQLYNGASVAAGFSNTVGMEVVLQNIPYKTYDVYVLVDALNINTAIDEVQNFAGGVVGGAGTPIYLTDSPGQQAGIDSVAFPGYVQATGTTTATATSGADYVLFSGLTNANDTIDLQDWTANHGGAPYDSSIAISGLEIVQQASAIPEPATLGLMGVLGAGLLLVGRKRKVA